MLPALPYVLIIDEINRGNVSQIFGELITLIEESKRLGEVVALEVTLSYSKKKFGVPSNVYIIGTMNTADRSVEALDTALRRRFSFVEMMPNEKVFEKLNFTDSYDRKGIMKKVNQRIEVLLDRNYMLGHSYFIKADFKNSFENEIMPLLQEYFYNDSHSFFRLNLFKNPTLCGSYGIITIFLSLVIAQKYLTEKELRVLLLVIAIICFLHPMATRTNGTGFFLM